VNYNFIQEFIPEKVQVVNTPDFLKNNARIVP
jgi:hypothetical protein